MVVVVLAAAGFVAFLYFIPPFTLVKPEEFSRPMGTAGPDLTKISDPTERMLAERGHYLVTLGSCSDCHSTPGPQGPRIGDMYLAGGFKATRKGHGTYVSSNLTSDQATGIGSWTDEDLKRVLRSGQSPDGTSVPGHLMPWPAYSHLTDEDLHAIVVYLRRTAPIVHAIPKATEASFTDPTAYEEDYAGVDYAAPPK
ncbi:MAG: hypothetical protein IT176_12945 [Acidobacteria bacterium]|nr:hypothetical protein [Acidobacteriota bacterium]